MFLLTIKKRLARVFRKIRGFVCFDETREIYHGDSFKSYWEEYYEPEHRSFLSAFKVKLQARIAFLNDGFRLDEFYLLGLERKK